jgi:branched-subunit amino acid ABC-type transport system permease component
MPSVRITFSTRRSVVVQLRGVVALLGAVIEPLLLRPFYRRAEEYQLLVTFGLMLRHECTDHVIVFNEDHLRRILSNYANYYNEVRTQQ